MAYQNLLFNQDNGIATLTFNRPEKLNALNTAMVVEFAEAITEVSRTPDIRVLILTGAGRAFVAGADVSALVGLDPLTGKRFAHQAQEAIFRLENLEIPVIAAVNGFALGGGLEIAMACDLIYASEEAKFGQPEVNLGILPFIGGTQRLTRLVGKVVAKELCLTGRFLEAGEAKALGLVAQVFPAANLLEECLKVARGLATKSRVALRAIKQVINRGLDMDLTNACSLEVDALAVCLASPDAQEGIRAFLEKRPPKFADYLP